MNEHSATSSESSPEVEQGERHILGETNYQKRKLYIALHPPMVSSTFNRCGHSNCNLRRHDIKNILKEE